LRLCAPPHCGPAAGHDRGVALDDQIRAYLARIGRRGGKARMRQVGSAEQAAFARAGWKGLTKKQRAKRGGEGVEDAEGGG
jgi:hypothetical protein